MAYGQASHEVLWCLPTLPTVAELQGYHVTDDPRPVETAQRAGIPLDTGMDASPTDDLKASGLYISECPNLWVARSVKKWRFAASLTPGQRGAIAQTIRQDSRFTGAGYLTDGEKERGTTLLEHFAERGGVECLEELAMQPYSFATWKPGFLAQLGVVNYDMPQIVPVRAQGSFADVSSVSISPDLMIALKLCGHGGAFVNGGMAFLPQGRRVE